MSLTSPARLGTRCYSHAAVHHRMMGGSGLRPCAPASSVHRPAAARPATARACTARSQEGNGPHAGGLNKYLTGLLEEERVFVVSKLAQHGYDKPGCEDDVQYSDDNELQKLGIEPVRLRSKLLQAFALKGPAKRVVMCYDDGNEVHLKFKNKRTFEKWAAEHMPVLLDDGAELPVTEWEDLEDGATYRVPGTTLDKRVNEVAAWQRGKVAADEFQAREWAVAQLEGQGEKDVHAFCFKRIKTPRGAVAIEVDGMAHSESRAVLVERKPLITVPYVEDLRAKMITLRMLVDNWRAPNTDVLINKHTGNMKDIDVFLMADGWEDHPAAKAACKVRMHELGIKPALPRGSSHGVSCSCEGWPPQEADYALAKTYQAKG